MVTQERLMELLDYDPDTGIFTRRTSKKGQAKGSKAGCLEHSGYIKISIDGKMYRAHRLAWLYVHGFIPHVIDHINGVRSDNRMANIREADQRINNQNRHCTPTSSSGFHGVSKSRGAWRATISDRKRQIHLGVFESPEEAHAAYISAKKQIHEGATL